MRFYNLLLILIITGCISPPPPPPLPYQPIVASNLTVKQRADELNWTVLYMYAYVKTYNEYAITQGWTPPKVPAICRMGHIPNLPEIPKFQPSNQLNFEKDLVEYIKEVRRTYKNTAQLIEAFEDTQQRTCLY